MNLPEQLTPTATLRVDLPSGGAVQLPLCKPNFSRWHGSKIFNYGGKKLLDHKGEACFAELAILRILLESGWEGVWIESFGGPHYVRTMPKNWNLSSEHIALPAEKENLLKQIWTSLPNKPCFDVFAWKNDETLFCEAKLARKDKLTKPQAQFIESALKVGLKPDALLIVEWSI